MSLLGHIVERCGGSCPGLSRLPATNCPVPNGGPGRDRTCDPAVNNRSLFRLSYETILRWAVRTHRATGKELKVKTGSDIGGRRFLFRQLHSSIFRQVDTMGFSYFRNVLHKNPRPLFPPPPPEETGIASADVLPVKFLRGGRGCVYIALYPARETPPVFPLPLGTPPVLPGSRASPAAETTAPAPELLNRPAPAGAANRNCPDRKRKYTESTQQPPKPSRRNRNI